MLHAHYLTCDLDGLHPRFSWKISTDLPNAMQQAYHLEVCADGFLHDSGEVFTDQSIFVAYCGSPLHYAAVYSWRVRVCVNDAWSEWSDYAAFETALEKWQAPFIQADDAPGESCAKIFRREITLRKPVQSARVYATALGLYDLQINGRAVTDTCFNPGWSAYQKRVLYQTFDPTPYLSNGKNTLEATVAPGWYKGDLGFVQSRNLYGDKMAFAAQIDITYTDGSAETILTDESWQFADSPIVYTEIYHGETYDARRENPTHWQPATLMPAPAFAVEPFDGVPVRRQEVFAPIAFFTTPKGERVLDFGQNLTGWVAFHVSGNAGDQVILRHAEALDSEGNFYTDNLRHARCTDTYILGGGSEKIYQPRFTFHGFRYVALDAYPGDIDPARFEAVALYSDMEKTGDFECSEPLINQLQKNITWGLRGNFLDIPTDCPQRDERMGWTGDAQVFIPTAAYLYDVRVFFKKWLRDLALEQYPDGGVPYVVPDIIRLDPKLDFEHSSCGWGDAAVIVPWALYQAYGDARLLANQYASMRGWVEYIRARANNNLWNTGYHYADWVALDAKEGSCHGATPTDLCATAYYAYSTSLLAKAAAALGNDADAVKYRSLHADIVQAYQQEFFTPTGRLAAHTQTAHILSLVFDLTPDAFISRTIGTLVQLIADNGGHLVTGFLGTPHFCHALSQNNRLAEAYALLQREEYPSWLYQVKAGATTIWEHMDGIKPDGTLWSAEMNSFNHYAYGAIGDWLYTVVAGITPTEPGYKRIKIAPQPGGTLTHARATLRTPYGTLESAWEIKDEKFSLRVIIPPNTTAEVRLPNGEVHTVGSGTYVYAGEK